MSVKTAGIRHVHHSLALHLVRGDDRVGENGGYEPFGITVLDRESLDEAVAAIEAAGGTLVEKGEHAPGVPPPMFGIPTGYVIEI